MRLADTAALGRAALDLLLPPHCLGCEALVAQAGRFCAACFNRLGFISEPMCRRCGAPFAHAGQGGAAHLCPACTETPPDFDRARGALRYDAHSRGLILAFKHADRPETAGALAALMARAGAALLAQAELIVPVPLHRRRLFARRYNQAALLALALGRLARRTAVPDALLRLRATAPLGEKSAAERAAEVAAAFAVRPRRAGRIAGRRVLLVDDVLTSGATANACARTLRAAGAIAVDVLVAARVPDPRLG
ncbi:MAG TPA: double zinc ribbon domain-containing protein [Acetobacteraceae bacterium]|nr:double zinc ribbon domain-containing protein [Acetobacteraceae bacterium]